MIFIGIDLHTNRFTCCYRDGRRSDRPGDRVTKTFGLDDAGGVGGIRAGSERFAFWPSLWGGIRAAPGYL
jgi:hypothetical protein